MIQRYQHPAAKKLGMLSGHVILHAAFLCFLALMISGSHAVGILLFGALYAWMAYLTFTFFIRGRIHAVYLLSGRTLAVVRPRRRPRFVKPSDILAYRQQTRSFQLTDGSKLGCWIPNREIEFAQNLITRWYGDETLESLRKRGTIDLSNAEPRPAPTVQRFPRQRPRGPVHAAFYAVLLFVFVITVVPAVAYITAYLPDGIDAALFLILFTVLFLSPSLGYIALRCYRLFLRGDLFTTVLISGRTLAVVRPRQATRFIKRHECAAYQPALLPSLGKIVLTDGTRIGFGMAEALSEPPGPTVAVWRRWWPYVPENKRFASLAPYRLALAATAVGVGLAIYSQQKGSNTGIICGAVIILGTIGYMTLWSVLSDGPAAIPLRPEFYPTTATGSTRYSESKS